MADRVQYLEYTVYMNSKEEAERYQAAYPNGVRIAPDAIATQLGYPVVLHDITAPFYAPSIRSPYFTPSSKYPRNVAEFEICRGGWFGICALFGRNTTYKWVAKYEWVATPLPEVEGETVVPEVIQQLSWIDGFERAGYGAGGAMPMISRAASRHADGYGFSYRSPGASEYFAHQVTELGAAARKDTWERFYMRPRRAPSVSAGFWQCKDTSNRGIVLELTPSLTFSVFNSTSGATLTMIGATTTPLVAGEWHKIDILLQFDTGRIRIYSRGVLLIDVTTALPGFSDNVNHNESRLGYTGTAANDAEIDFDDWTGATIPPTFNGVDWLNGTKCVQVLPSALTGNNTFGTRTYRALLHNPQRNSTTPGIGQTSSTSGAIVEVSTDGAYSIDKCEGSLGCIGIVEEIVLSSNAIQVAQLGLGVAGAAPTVAAINETNSTHQRHYKSHRPSGLTAPVAVTPVTLRYEKALNVNPITVYTLMAEAALVGTFGDADVKEETVGDVTAKPAPRLGEHNGPYPRSLWAKSQLPPTAPVIIVAGTYTGNDTGQDLTFRAPVNFFMARRSSDTTSNTGSRWWSSMLGNHLATGERGLQLDGMIQAAEDVTYVSGGTTADPEERYVLRINGNGAAFNALGVTYQYIAVIDPSARFMLNGGFRHTTSLASASNALKKSDFTPAGAYIVREQANVSGTVEGGFKGPGNAASGFSKFGVGELTGAYTFAEGVITSESTNGHPADLEVAFSAWRTDDGSGDSGVPKVVKIGSYTGNGAASRTITFAPASGVRPLFAEVVPSNAANAVRRDPAHTGVTSTDSTGAQNVSTGITSGGIDEMTVGSALNSNGIVYNYFVLMGSATAGNNGWSINGEFAPVEPEYDEVDPIAEPPEFEDPDDPDPVDPDPDPGPSDEDDCDAGEVCVAATTREVNLALLEIGNTKFLTNYCTQQTLEARTARILYETSVRAVLHEFPWPFATKYAALSLTVAQPDHEDWEFSYRLPVDCIFPRRIVVDRGPGVDPKGPGFELSSDASGGILLTNEEDAVLEYTCRPSCVAYTGDPLFREAVKWHLAGAMAPPLTRMKDKAAFCREQYEICIAKANAIIKPGQPGLRTAIDPAADDAGAACQTANTMVANVALIRIGANTIANLTTDQSREAVAVNLLFEHELRATLRDFPWKFAKRYNEALVTVGGTSTVPANVDWQYSYRLPTDYVAVRRLATTGTGRSFETNPPTFEVGTDATGYLLFTGELDPNLEYTARIPCAVAKADDLFRDALAWRLAASLAPSLAQHDPEQEEARGRGPEYPPNPEQRISHKPNKGAMRERAARYAMAMYLRVIEKARVVDANEAEPEDPGDAPWITGRD